MAKIESNMMPLGTKAPAFELVDTYSGKIYKFPEETVVPTVVVFICNHCPFVVHIHEKLLELAREYKQKNINFIAISANDPEQYPDDSPEEMRARAQHYDYPFPYLFDAEQKVAKAYNAACTPDFFVFDSSGFCVYRGRFDGSSPGNQEPVSGKDLAAALDAILAGKSVSADQKPSMGCSIKWRAI